ncbi:unnamed protein product, partial [marine sediment metagenome]
LERLMGACLEWHIEFAESLAKEKAIVGLRTSGEGLNIDERDRKKTQNLPGTYHQP